MNACNFSAALRTIDTRPLSLLPPFLVLAPNWNSSAKSPRRRLNFGSKGEEKAAISLFLFLPLLDLIALFVLVTKERERKREKEDRVYKCEPAWETEKNLEKVAQTTIAKATEKKWATSISFNCPVFHLPNVVLNGFR